ncbi:MAG TPA: MFS transporter [Gemmatimonadaceae bacterium]|nr:MFS transporter [Gemmatimonadaceae bacterium]
MARARHPWVFAVLYFPYGLSIGFPSIALGFLGRRAGMPTSAIAGMVGMTFLAAGWKFLWAPLGDYTLSRKRWYLLAVGLISCGLVALTVVPLSTRTAPLVSLLVLLTAVSATFLAFATEGLMVHNTTPDTRGRAGGWFQSGNQFGQTAGGGLGLWLVSHASAPWQGGVALAALVAACALALRLVDEPPRQHAGATLGSRGLDAWHNLVGVLKSRIGRVGLLLAILPIGTGAAAYLFGSLGPEWHAPADTVSLVLGAGGGLAIVAGCFAGGRVADRLPPAVAYALSCGLGLLACVAIALSPRTETGYAATTLLYTFTLGMVASSFTALVLAIVGHAAPATKINLFFAINTLFSLGVLRADGWAHDRWGTNGMLYTEALLGAGALVVFALVAGRVRGSSLVAEGTV